MEPLVPVVSLEYPQSATEEEGARADDVNKGTNTKKTYGIKCLPPGVTIFAFSSLSYMPLQTRSLINAQVICTYPLKISTE